MPTSSPRKFTNAPPELPGLMAASVWMKSSYSGFTNTRATERADNAGRHRLAKAKRIADGDHEVADVKPITITHRDSF